MAYTQRIEREFGMDRFNVAIVGCGMISELHITALCNEAKRARIVACCDNDAAKAESAVRNVETLSGTGARVETDYDKLLGDPEIDAVVLCLPHHLHAPMSIAALHAGKHVLCEKPLALNLEECDRMIEAAQQAGKVLMHGENMRMAPGPMEAAHQIQSGRLGTIVGIQATYAHWQGEHMNKSWRARNNESGGGHLMDGGIHFIDIMRHLGGPIVAVHAMTTRYRPELGPDVEDTGVLNLRYENGSLGQLFASHASRGRGASSALTVFGTEGCLSTEAFGGDGAVMLFRHKEAPVVLLRQQSWQDTFDSEIGHFLDVVMEGKPLLATPEDGRENLKVVLAAYESARTRTEVSLV